MDGLTDNNLTNDNMNNNGSPSTNNALGDLAGNTETTTIVERTSQAADEEAPDTAFQHDNRHTSDANYGASCMEDNTPTIGSNNQNGVLNLEDMLTPTSQHGNSIAAAVGQTSSGNTQHELQNTSFNASAAGNEQITPARASGDAVTVTGNDNKKKRGMGPQQKGSKQNSRCWDKKKQKMESNNIPLPKKITAIRSGSQEKANFALVVQSIKHYAHTFERKTTKKGNSTRPFPKEDNRDGIYVAMGVLQACLKNTNIYNPIHAGDFKDDLNTSQQKDNRNQLRNYFVDKLGVLVSTDDHESNSLMARLCRTMSRMKKAPREEHEDKYNMLLKHFMPIDVAQVHLSAYEDDKCLDPKCALCRSATTTANSFHTEKMRWDDGCMLFYKPQPHLEESLAGNQHGVLPSPQYTPTSTAATPGSNSHNIRSSPVSFRVESLHNEDKCWFVGDDISSTENGATIFDPLSEYSGCTLTPAECNFVEKQLPRAFACKGSINFFAHLLKARQKHMDGLFEKSSRFIQANCVELYVDVEAGQNRDTACIEHFLHTFCSHYDGNALEVLRKYAKAQLDRDPRTHSKVHNISNCALIICLAGAPAQNIHGDHNMSNEFQGTVTLTTDTPTTQLYYGMQPLNTFQALLDLWASFVICRKFNLQIPDAERAKELEDELDASAASIISDYGTTFLPASLLNQYEVDVPASFTNKPGTQIVMSSCFLHAGPGLPQSVNAEAVPPFIPTNADIKRMLSPTYTATDADMQEAPPRSIRAGMFFSTHVSHLTKYDDDKQYYGFNAMFQLAVRLWDALTDNEKRLFEWLLADYAFKSTCNVMPFLYNFKNHDLYNLAESIEQRRSTWLSSSTNPTNVTEGWYNDVRNLLAVWKGGCNVDMEHFNSLLRPTLQSMSIVSLLDDKGQKTAESTGCMWVDNSGKRHMLQTFDSMINTSNKTNKGMAPISDTNMYYSKYDSAEDSGIAALITNNVFGGNGQIKDKYYNLGDRLEEKIMKKLRETLGAHLQRTSIVCTLIRSDKGTKLQEWHYDYYPRKGQNGTTATPSFSCITPLTLGGSYVQLYNEDTHTPFILHIPRGFTLIFDDMTIHSGGYLFDEQTADKRLHHYIVFKGGPQLRPDHAIYKYRKNTKGEEDQQQDPMSTTIPSQFDGNNTMQEDELRRAGWFVFEK